MSLGVAKTQWYTQWIKRNVLRQSTPRKDRELALIHDFLESVCFNCVQCLQLEFIFDQFESPSWVGNLPVRVGEPAGGSLGADEYKVAITTPFAMIVSLPYFHTADFYTVLGSMYLG